jgi:hypothetical protein
MRHPLVVAAGTLLVAVSFAGCDSGPTVVLNQRIFSMPGMIPAGSGCMTFKLDSSGSSGSGAAGAGFGGLSVGLRQADDKVFVEVAEGSTVVVRRSYDEAFFRSQQVDEIRATGTSGEGVLLRHWGSYGVDGQPECAPSTDDGSRTK